jgi:hypothetical protein
MEDHPVTDVIRTPSPHLEAIAPPRLNHDEFRQIVIDVALSRRAIGTLCILLHDLPAAAAEDRAGPGLAVLLESSTQRLQMALDGLTETAAALQIEGVREITAGP